VARSYESEREAMLEHFGATLRELREAKFPSQEAFAQAAKLARSHVYLLETGQREPELATLLILAGALEVPLDRLTAGLATPKRRRSERGKPA
jgi:XRE family transcriptional regulator, regulator of sulfur utilization